MPRINSLSSSPSTDTQSNQGVPTDNIETTSNTSTFTSDSHSFSSSTSVSTSTSSSTTSSSTTTSSSFSSSSSSSHSTSVVTSRHFLVTAEPTPTPTADLFGTTPATTVSFTFPTDTTTSTAPTDTSTPPPSENNNVAAVTNGFWSHKSAVAGVFTVLGIILLAAIAFIVVRVLKKRKSPSFNDRIYDRFSDPPLQYSARTPSPGPSTAEMHQQSPLEVHDNYRDVFYNHPEPPSFQTHQQANVAPSLPPQSQDPFSNVYGYQASDLLPPPVVKRQRAPQEHPPSHNLPASLFTNASNVASGNTHLKPSNLPSGRGSYQQSIDSFYGGAGNAPSSGSRLPYS